MNKLGRRRGGERTKGGFNREVLCHGSLVEEHEMGHEMAPIL
jgi:hypothetical protein